MLSLIVDTHGERGGLALLDCKKNVFIQEWAKKSSHSEVITTEFQRLLTQAGMNLEDVGKIVVNHGPGSFTGLRVGLSFAKSLGYLLKIPMISFNTLEVMAFSHGCPGKILVTLPAIKGHLYAAGYELSSLEVKEILTPASQSEEQIENLKEIFEIHVDGTLEKNRTDVRDAVKFYQRRSRSFKETSWNFIQPLYLRRSQAEEKLRTGLLKPIYGESEHHVERKR